MAKKKTIKQPITKTINISDIIVDQRLRQNIGDIKPLAKDIKAHGLLHPPVVTPTNHLIAGGRRLEALKFLGIEEITVSEIDIADVEKLVEAEYNENNMRSDFLLTEKLEYARQMEVIEKAKAEERMKSGKTEDPRENFPKGTNTGSDPRENFPKGRVTQIVAKKCNLGSYKQYEKMKEIWEHESDFDPKDFEKWNKGELSTSKMYNKLKPPTEKHTPPFLKETKEEILKKELKQIDTLPQSFPDTLPSIEAGAQGRLNAFCEIILGQFMDWITVYKELFIQDLQSLPLKEKKRISEECFEPVVKELKNKHLAVKSVIASEENKNKPMRKMTQKELDNMKTTLPEEQKKGNWMNEEELKKATEYYANPTQSQKEEEFKKEWDRELTNVLGPNYQNDPDNYD